ncbi:UPF0603 protein [Porphyridium purpureum]|uniref:UPF0603 protein n=1 Tax=Porphyridium purpureum TaxID=35688 RepID=A0A5J4Z5S1_PORPP|nr:UPF0603 protein [Porphyridium purpureum]|eukprot:POR2526..scf295_1
MACFVSVSAAHHSGAVASLRSRACVCVADESGSSKLTAAVVPRGWARSMAVVRMGSAGDGVRGGQEAAARRVVDKQQQQPDRLRAYVAAVAVGAVMGAAVAGSTGGMALAEVPSSKPVALLIDDANVVTKSAQPIVEKAYVTLKNNTGFEVHFVTVRSFGGTSEPNEYANDLFASWGLGDKDVLVVGGTKVARAGIAAGAEAKKLLTDDIIASIGNETFALKARQEAYTASVLDVNNRLLPILYGKADPGPPLIQRESAEGTFKTKAETEVNKTKYWTIFGVLVAISFIVPFLQYFWYTGN